MPSNKRAKAEEPTEKPSSDSDPEVEEENTPKKSKGGKEDSQGQKKKTPKEILETPYSLPYGQKEKQEIIAAKNKQINTVYTRVNKFNTLFTALVTLERKIVEDYTKPAKLTQHRQAFFQLCNELHKLDHEELGPASDIYRDLAAKCKPFEGEFKEKEKAPKKTHVPKPSEIEEEIEETE